MKKYVKSKETSNKVFFFRSERNQTIHLFITNLNFKNYFYHIYLVICVVVEMEMVCCFIIKTTIIIITITAFCCCCCYETSCIFVSQLLICYRYNHRTNEIIIANILQYIDVADVVIVFYLTMTARPQNDEPKQTKNEHSTPWHLAATKKKIPISVSSNQLQHQTKFI